MSPCPTYFPLRWESTGDQWWYASPIDWAAANGHYDLVRELLRIDGNHLIMLTSLRRIRRLETVWDDKEQFHDVARCRSEVARKFLVECEIRKGKKSLIGSGYGGWLLYTAASAGDLSFAQELLDRDPLLVFGEGEYGVTDILYAAARSKSTEVFKVVLDFASLPRFSMVAEEVPSGYKLEIMNRALHAASRGGNLKLLKELFGDCSDDALAYRDIQGATVLHAAAARGQVEVVKYLTSSSSSEIINSTDNQGNTALHVAAHRGHLPVVEALITASPSSINATNNAGETFLHAVVVGFQTPSFRILDHQIELLKHLLYCTQLFDIESIINLKNKDGRTALHLAIMGNIHYDLVDLLMTIRGINVNIRDTNGMTPLDVLRQRPHSASSELLTRQLISAGGIFGPHSARRVMASHIKRQSSPGTAFRIRDVEMFLYTGMENVLDGTRSVGLSNYSPEVSHQDDSNRSSLPRETSKLGSVNYTTRLKRLLSWLKVRRDGPSERLTKLIGTEASEIVPVPLRERFSKPWSLPNNKRTLSVRCSAPSPIAKKKLASGGVTHKSRSSSFSNLSFSSQSSLDNKTGVGIENEIAKASCSKNKHGLVNNKLMNQYLCLNFGGTTQDATQQQLYDIYERAVLSSS